MTTSRPPSASDPARPADEATGLADAGVDDPGSEQDSEQDPAQQDPTQEDPEEEASAQRGADEPPEHFPIVGVGAASGGLEAFVSLLEGLPATIGLAIVFIPHLSAGRDLDFAKAFTAHTSMPTHRVDGPTRVEPGHLYLMTHGTQLTLRGWTLIPAPRDPARADHNPVDIFFSSLAADAGTCAIGLVLSGTGSDGMIGLREIKAVGGITMAQDPGGARCPSMPSVAIASGVVDLVLSPMRIAEELQRIVHHPYVRQASPRRAGEDLVILQDQMHRIFAMLRSVSGVDFTHYKPPTIRRRLQWRMVLHKIDSVDLYIAYLRENPDEVGKLYQDLLIHVTRFFRDPDSFRALVSEVFPEIVRQRRGTSPIRIWLPGCSTGEEAYSVAIVFIEFLGDDVRDIPVQIFATDVSETAIEQARSGLYPESIATDLTPERLRRFFTRVDGKYRIHKVVRDLCVFARQDLTRDPPFSKLDLILCRNVLIYMSNILQRKLMSVFHYALKSSGFLMLGGAETVGSQAELFKVVDKTHRIFLKKLSDQPQNLPVPIDYHPMRPVVAGPRAPYEPPASGHVQNEANRLVLDRYGPPGVIVDRDFEVIQFRGRTGDFLEPAPGDVTQGLNVLKMARDGLLHGLQSALFSSRKSETPVRKDGLQVRIGGQIRQVSLQVVPLSLGAEPRHYLVLFEDMSPRGEAEPAVTTPALTGSEDEQVRHLQDELAASREYLQSIIQDLEAANEELQSANEEILSSNEELQSTNEELDTAKEELQSTNEELNTVNEELHGRNEELSRVNSDLVNLLGCVEIAIVIVGADLAIRRFTPMAEKVLNLIATDIGRPISQIKPNIDCPGLERLIARVIDTVTPQEQSVCDSDGNWYSLRIRPYKNLDNRIDGAVLALFDIASRRHELELRQSHDNIRAIVETSHEPVLVLDSQLRITLVNRAFLRCFRMNIEGVLQRRIFDLGGGDWNIPALHTLLGDLIPNHGRIDHYHVEHDFVGVGHRRLRFNVSRVTGFEPSATMIVLAIVDADAGETDTTRGDGEDSEHDPPRR